MKAEELARLHGESLSHYREAVTRYRAIGAILLAARAEVGEAEFPEWLQSNFNAPAQDVEIYIAWASSTDEEMAALGSNGGRGRELIALAGNNAITSNPDSLENLAARANRSDAAGVDHYQQYKIRIIETGNCLIEAAKQFKDSPSYDRWLAEHFLSTNDRAKACITLARHLTAGLTEFDQLLMEDRLGDILEGVKKTAPAEPQGTIDEARRLHGLAVKAGADFRAHCRSLGSVLKTVFLELGEEAFLAWVSQHFEWPEPATRAYLMAAELSNEEWSAFGAIGVHGLISTWEQKGASHHE